MQLTKPGAEIFVPDGEPVEAALARTDSMGIGAHQDDLEIMAFDGILKAFGHDDKWFCGVTVTNGAGSPRADLYGDYTDEMMQDVRHREQKKAAVIGEYAAQALLDYASSEVKDASNPAPVEDLKGIILAARPSVIYTHNLADKHPTHVAVALRTIQALRELKGQHDPEKLYACEVWRDLDWLWNPDDDDPATADPRKVAFHLDTHENLAASLLGVFDSQVCGGKRYDLATMGRRRANATYHSSHAVQVGNHVIFALDLTPLIEDPDLDVKEYIAGFIERFAADVTGRIDELTA